MKSLLIAFAMYSKIPVPQVEWEKKSLSRALCWLPLVGIIIGAVLALWLTVSRHLGLAALRSAGAVAIPLALSGAIHLDGFCDTCDALSSHQSRERKLEILKDSHTGAFAIICCCLYLLLFYAAWREVEAEGIDLILLCLSPALSRCFSGLAAVSWPNARGSGLLATFTQPMDAKKARVVLISAIVVLMGAMVFLAADAGAWYTLALPGAALLTFLYYRLMAMGQFGGITGDTEGFFVQVCECVMVLALVLGQRIWEVLV